MSKSEDIRLLRRSEVEEQFGISVRFLELAVTRGDGPPIVRLGSLPDVRCSDVDRAATRSMISHREQHYRTGANHRPVGTVRAFRGYELRSPRPHLKRIALQSRPSLARGHRPLSHPYIHIEQEDI